MRICVCNSDAYHSFHAKVQKTFCFRCGAYVNSEILIDIGENETLQILEASKPLNIPDVLEPATKESVIWKNIPESLFRKYNWYVSHMKEHGYFLILPVYRNGKMVFWTARNLQIPAEPKYLSAHGSKKQYWLSEEYYPTGDVFIAESIVDACYLSQLGQSVGLLGTSYNNSLNNWLKSATRIIICFDADTPGRVGSLILAKQLQDQGICKRIYILPLPDNTDPVDHKIEDLKRWISELH